MKVNEPSLIAHFYARPVLLGRLIICPHCLTQNRQEILGALNEDGFVVSRNNQSSTKIYGNFLILCSRCKKPIVHVFEEVDSELNAYKKLFPKKEEI